ncbi:hypothetical protein MPSEU_000151300 [Mayamaea pseudoterrestris]|nr:hypothetical protein MPSEU_000151300 [Mayamaea pseudoterrestris]
MADQNRTAPIHCGRNVIKREELDQLLANCIAGNWNLALDQIKNDPRLAATQLHRKGFGPKTTVLHEAIYNKSSNLANLDDRIAFIKDVLKVNGSAACLENQCKRLPFETLFKNQKLTAKVMPDEKRLEIAQALMEANTVDFLQDENNDTFLHRVLVRQDAVSDKIIKYLVEMHNGAACFIENNKGYLPAHVAAKSCYSILKMDILLDSNPEAIIWITNDGKTVAMLAENGDRPSSNLTKHLKAREAEFYANTSISLAEPPLLQSDFDVRQPYPLGFSGPPQICRGFGQPTAHDIAGAKPFLLRGFEHFDVDDSRGATSKMPYHPPSTNRRVFEKPIAHGIAGAKPFLHRGIEHLDVEDSRGAISNMPYHPHPTSRRVFAQPIAHDTTGAPPIVHRGFGQFDAHDTTRGATLNIMPRQQAPVTFNAPPTLNTTTPLYDGVGQSLNKTFGKYSKTKSDSPHGLHKDGGRYAASSSFTLPRLHNGADVRDDEDDIICSELAGLRMDGPSSPFGSYHDVFTPNNKEFVDQGEPALKIKTAQFCRLLGGVNLAVSPIVCGAKDMAKTTGSLDNDKPVEESDAGCAASDGLFVAAYKESSEDETKDGTFLFGPAVPAAKDLSMTMLDDDKMSEKSIAGYDAADEYSTSYEESSEYESSDISSDVDPEDYLPPDSP